MWVGVAVACARRSTAQLPRIASAPGIARINPAIVTRARVADPAVQPMSINPRARVPDIPKEAADVSANTKPGAAPGARTL